MKNYSDGNWHFWGGVGVPDGIPAKSTVQYVWHNLEANGAGLGCVLKFKDSDGDPAEAEVWKNVIRFRVVRTTEVKE